MLKRLFQVPLSTDMQLTADSSLPTIFPQPIKAADNQRLMKLSDAPSTVCVSDWSHSQQFNSSATNLSATNSSATNLSVDTVSSETLQVDELKQHIWQQQRLQQVERKLSQTLNFSTIAGTTVVETAGLFKAKQVNLLRYDDDTSTCQQVVRYCQNQRLAWQPAFSITETEFPLLLQLLRQEKILQISAEQIEASAISSGNDDGNQITIAPDANSVPTHEAQQWLARWPGSWLLIPIRKSQHIRPLPTESAQSSHIENSNYWGFMALALPERERWTENAAIAAHSITVTFTAAMQHAQQYHELMVTNKELQKLALSDGLTCLANRRRFDEHLADEWQRLAREQKPLSLILCDLDHFKRYNDTFGHPAGDRCLIRVARALLSGPQRPADLVARYGGEEFAIVLPNTDTHGAWRIAQKIHDSIRALQIDHAPDNEEPYVTVTMGVSTVIPGHDNTAQMLVQASDLALYHAKQQGRNRTYVNGHYNTVSEEQMMGDRTEGTEQLDVMPLEATQ